MALNFFTTNQTGMITSARAFDVWHLRDGLTWTSTASLFTTNFSENAVIIEGVASGGATGFIFRTSGRFMVGETGSVLSTASAGNSTVFMAGTNNSVVNHGEITAIFGYAVLTGLSFGSPVGLTRNSVTNHGDITGFDGGVFLGLFGGQGDILNNYGTITSTATTGFARRGNAVTIEGNAAVVINHGTIQATGVDSAGVRVGTDASFTATNGTNSRVVNHGLITSVQGNSITLEGLQTGTARIENFGTLIGDVELTARGDAIINRGLIQGDVIMGAGLDTYDGQGGRVQGTIFGGAGADTYIVSQADVKISETGQDVDTIISSIDFSLETYELVEALVLSGAASIDAEGNDLDNLLTGNAANNTLAGGLGNDTLQGGRGFDRLLGDEGQDSLIGGNGYDLLEGGVGNDTLFGQFGHDTLFGGAGNDALYGGEHDDVISGGRGRDTLSGGTGEDLFLFRSLAEVGTGSADADTITDFVSGEDIIDLSGLDANTTLAGNQAFVFIGASAYTNVAGQLRATAGSSSGFLQADLNGDGVADMLLRLTGTPPVLAGDLVL